MKASRGLCGLHARGTSCAEPVRHGVVGELVVAEIRQAGSVAELQLVGLEIDWASLPDALAWALRFEYIRRLLQLQKQVTEP